MAVMALIEDTLTDGSTVYGVRVCDGEATVDLDVTSEKSAYTLMEALFESGAGVYAHVSGQLMIVKKRAGWEV